MSGPREARALALVLLRWIGAWLQRLPRAFWWCFAIAWMGAIAWLSSLPASDLPPSPFGAFGANLVHAFLYGMLALWLALGMPRAEGWPRLDARARLCVFVVVVGYGAFDEWRQSATPGREPSSFDLLTDFVGAWCVLWIASYVPRASATGLGLAARLALCIALCAAAAGLATLSG